MYSRKVTLQFPSAASTTFHLETESLHACPITMNWRILLLPAVLCALFPAQGNAAEPAHVQIVRGGKEVRQSPKSNFVPNVIALIESCSVHSTAYAVTNSTWTNLLQSPSFVRVTFTPARKLNVMMTPGVGARERVVTEIDQVLIPLPENNWPAHMYGRIGDQIYSFTKYNPIALKHLVLEPALALSSTKPYSGLINLPER